MSSTRLEPPVSLEDARKLMRATDAELKDLMKISKRVSEDIHGPVIYCYTPGRKFPAISITGHKCWLMCRHCMGHYLKGMIPVSTPFELYELCKKLKEEGAHGCLISGGFTKEGALPLRPFIPVLESIKRETGLLLNAHPGFVSDSIITELARVNVDAVSIDVVGSRETAKSVYGLDRGPEDYERLLRAFKASGIRIIAPHICVGLHFGKIVGELRALSIIREIDPSVLVLIFFIPTRNTPMASCPPPDLKNVLRFIIATRLVMPHVPLSVGCMRPGGSYRRLLDAQLVRLGVNRVVIPAKELLLEAKKEGYEVINRDLCCVFT